jgi:hypothetical protein
MALTEKQQEFVHGELERQAAERDGFEGAAGYKKFLNVLRASADGEARAKAEIRKAIEADEPDRGKKEAAQVGRHRAAADFLLA